MVFGIKTGMSQDKMKIRKGTVAIDCSTCKVANIYQEVTKAIFIDNRGRHVRYQCRGCGVLFGVAVPPKDRK